MVASGAATGGHDPEGRGLRPGGAVTVSRHAHILDGRTPHALLLELFTDEGVGTMVGVDL